MSEDHAHPEETAANKAARTSSARACLLCGDFSVRFFHTEIGALPKKRVLKEPAFFKAMACKQEFLSVFRLRVSARVLRTGL
jgi:hypothetical protein